MCALKRNWSNKGTHWRSHKYDCISKAHQDYIKEYRVWVLMRNRCNNENSSMYHVYGGRGIKVCDRWNNLEEGFINFYNDMGQAPIDENGRRYQIDRIDPNGDYCPENCRWVPALINARNKRDSHYVWLNGEKIHAQQAAKIFGLKGRGLVENARRHKDGLDCSEALIRLLTFHGRLTSEGNIV